MKVILKEVNEYGQENNFNRWFRRYSHELFS